MRFSSLPLKKRKVSSARTARRPRKKLGRSLRLEHLERRELLTTVNVSATDSTASEEPDAYGVTDHGEFTITRDNVTSDSLTVTFKVTGSADYGSDYDSPPNYWYYDSYEQAWMGSVTIEGNQASATVDIRPINDASNEDADPNDTDDDAEEVVLTIIDQSGCCCCGSSGYTAGASSEATVTIADNDDWQVDIQADDSQAAETGASEGPDIGRFVVTRSGETDLTHSLTVDFTVTGSAEYGSDYNSDSGYWYYDWQIEAYRGSVTIPANSATAAVEITPINDSAWEDPEDVTITLLEQSGCCCGSWGYTVGSPSDATVTIDDNDYWRVSIATDDPDDLDSNPADATEGTTDYGFYTITRDNETDKTYGLTVEFLITGTADPANDYSLWHGPNYTNSIYTWQDSEGKLRGSATIPAGETQVSIRLNASSDSYIEIDEEATLKLVETEAGSCCGAAASYTVGNPSQATVTIHDDSLGTIPTLTIKASDNEAFEPTKSGEAGDPGEFVIHRTGDISSSLSVSYTVSGKATNDVDYAWLSGSVEIPAGESEVRLVVDPKHDQLENEGEENVTLTLQDGGGCCCGSSSYALGAPSSATVTIKDSGEQDSKLCDCSCSCNPEATREKTDPTLGGLIIQAIGGLFQYFSPFNPHPIVTADVQLNPTNGYGTLTSVEASLDLDGVQSATVYYSGSGVQAGELYRFALQADASTLETGMHPWTMTVVQRYSDGSSTTDAYYGQKVINNRRDSEYGNRWSIRGVDRLVAHEQGADLVRGDGNVVSFWKDGQGGWRSEPGSGFVTLTGDDTNGYTLTDKYGNETEFNAAGLLVARRDRLGNETSYTYTGERLTQITDAAGETTTFTYGGDGLLDSMTDHAGRVTTFSHDASGRLASITQPDPDGAGPKAAPVTTFGYDPTTHLMTSLTDAENKTSTFGYDFAGTLETITGPDQESKTLRGVQVSGVVNPSSGAGTAANPAPLVRTADVHGERRDELNELTTFEVDRFGLTTKQTDALGNVTTYERNSHGQVTRMVEPDPDGAGPLTAPETLYQYDAQGNLTQITHPDGSTESWLYHATLNVPTQYTDPLGNVTVYLLDTATGLVLQERRIVGADDGASSETDDVVTAFTYTPAPTLSTDPPAGLVKTMTDPLGRLTRFDYNEHGLVTKITYAVGTTDEAFVQFEYDNAHNLTAAIDELARRTEYDYDALDRLIQITLADPDGAGAQTSPIYTFEYDKNNRLIKETDPLGRQTIYTYSDRGELLTVTRPDHDGDLQPTVTTMTYTAREELDTITDPLGRVTDFLYDALGRNTQVALPDPDGAGSQTAPVTTFAYDNLGRFVQVLDALNNPTDTAYANFGRTITTTQADPDGAGAQTRPQTTSQFDAAGNLTSVTDALGNVTTYEYDELNRLVKVTLPDPDGAGAQTSPMYQYQYDKIGNLRFETDPRGNVTEYQYDARNRLVKIIAADPDGAGSQTSPVTTFAYDDAGQLISDSDPLGNVTTREYDKLGRITKVTAPDPDGVGPQLASQTTFTYDAVGNLLTVTDALNQTTTYQYDAHNNRTKIIDAELGETVFTFDDLGNLLTLTDPELNTTSWVYDGLNRAIEETNELNATRYFAYNAVGNLTRNTDRNGRVTEYDYDNLHRLTAERWMNGVTTVRTLSFGYDANSQLLSASDPAAAYTYAYDNLGRTTDVLHDLAALSFNVELLSEYDLASNRTDLKALVGGTADFWNEYLYDDLHRLTSVQQHGAAGGSTVAEKRVDFDYDAASRWQTITRYEDLSGFELVATSTYAFDNAGRLTDLTHAKGANTLADYGWTYDVGNRITAFTSPDGSSTYTYDDTDQLVGADHTYQTDETYSYLCSCQLAAQEFFVSRVCLLAWITGTPEEREGGGGLGEGTGASGPSPKATQQDVQGARGAQHPRRPLRNGLEVKESRLGLAA